MNTISLVNKIELLVRNSKAMGVGTEGLKQSILRLGAINFEAVKLSKTIDRIARYNIVMPNGEFIIYIEDYIDKFDIQDTIVVGNLYIVGGRDIEDLDYSFARTEIRGTLYLNWFKPKCLKEMINTFHEAKIGHISFGSFDTSNLTDMFGTFSGCTTDSVDISGLNLSNVTRLTYAFMESNIKHVNLSGLNIPKVINIDGMFIDSNIGLLDFRDTKLNPEASSINLFHRFNVDKLILGKNLSTYHKRAKKEVRFEELL